MDNAQNHGAVVLLSNAVRTSSPVTSRMLNASSWPAAIASTATWLWPKTRQPTMADPEPSTWPIRSTIIITGTPSLEVAPTTLAIFLVSRGNGGGCWIFSTEDFRLAVTYLQFPIHVCFSATGFAEMLISSCDRWHWSVPLTSELDLDSTKMNQNVTYISKII